MLSSIFKWLSKNYGYIVLATLLILLFTTKVSCILEENAEQAIFTKQMKETCQPDYFVRKEKAAEGLWKITCINKYGNYNYVFVEHK